MLLLAADGEPWLDPAFFGDYREEILAAAREHVVLTVSAVALGLLVALPLALLARRSPRTEDLVLGAAGVVYTIPSLALFALLYPLPGFGLSRLTVLTGLVAYTLVILIRNVLTGLQGVPAEVREAATGLGFGAGQRLVRVELPLALPAVLAGVRVATVSTVALVTVGALVGHGGFGSLILSGFTNNLYRTQITVGCLGCVVLAVTADLLLLGLQRLATPWARRA